MTRAKIAAAAIAAERVGQTIAAQSLWNRINEQQSRPMMNQRQRRKFNRGRHAAGDKTAFA